MEFDLEEATSALEVAREALLRLPQSLARDEAVGYIDEALNELPKVVLV